jgi:hypothetical protein
MSRRKKKGEPELLIVSFCDIVTITTAAMFFAMLITVQEAVKIPVFKPTPRAVPTDKSPVFFECRNDHIYYVDKDGLDSQVAKLLSTLNPGFRSGDLSNFLKAIGGQEIGNEYYRVDPKYLLVGVMALDLRPDARGEDDKVIQSPNSRFGTALAQIDTKTRYIAFLVRDDSFNVFRKARHFADKADFDSGWELLGADEPIKFGAGGVAIAPQ